MSEKLSSIATLKAKEGKGDELGQRLAEVVEPTRAEPGCINYDVHRSADDESVWVVYENWRSKADLDAHFETPHIKEFIGHAADLLAEELDLRLLTMTSTQVAPKAA